MLNTLLYATVLFFSSPAFVTKLVRREDILMGNVNTSPKSKDEDNIMDSGVGVSGDFCALDVNDKGIYYCP